MQCRSEMTYDDILKTRTNCSISDFFHIYTGKPQKSYVGEGRGGGRKFSSTLLIIISELHIRVER